MKTIQIPEADLIKTEHILRQMGAWCSIFPRNIYVVPDETYEALKAGGVRLRRKDPKSVKPIWHPDVQRKLSRRNSRGNGI